MKKKLFGIIVLIVVFGLSGMTSNKALAAASVTLTASPTSITTGQSSTLSWSGTGITSCSPTSWTTSTATSGQQIVSPTSSATYRINCTTTAGDFVLSSASVTVTAPAQASCYINSLYVYPNTGTLPTNVGVTWSFSNNCPVATLTNSQGGSYTPGTTSGTWNTTGAADGESYILDVYDVAPNSPGTCPDSNTTTFGEPIPASCQLVLVASKAVKFQSSMSANVIVTETPASCVPWRSSSGFTTSPYVVTFPNTYPAPEAVYPIIGNGPSASVVPGFQWINPGGKYYFAISCSGTGQNTPRVVLSAPNNGSYQCKTGTTISWSSTNATSCSASWTTSTAVSGSQFVNPSTSPQSYVMTCTNGTESASSSPLVLTASDANNGSCPATPNPPKVTVTASPTSINSGQSSTLKWSTTNGAASCSAWWTTSSATSGSQVVSPVANTTYSMTCSNSGGSGSGSATVTVNPATTASIIVNSQPQSQWTIYPTLDYGSGLTQTTTVTPSSSGTSYTVDPAMLLGWGYPPAITSTMAGGNTGTVTLFPGDTVGFNLLYAAIPGFSYTLSNSGTTNITKGGANVYGQNTITKTLTSGTSQATAISLSGVPSLSSNGITYSVANQTCSPTCSSTITFTVPPTTPAGTYAITVSAPNAAAPTFFNLVIKNSSAIVVTCNPSPATALVGQNVTWTANATGGTGGPYTYSWSGTNVPTNMSSTTSSFNIVYSTIGQKTANVTVTDANSNTGSCSAPGGTIQINFNPQFKEF